MVKNSQTSLGSIRPADCEEVPKASAASSLQRPPRLQGIAHVSWSFMISHNPTGVIQPMIATAFYYFILFYCFTVRMTKDLHKLNIE